MQKILTLTCLFSLCFFIQLDAQTSKGIWMVNGNLETNTFMSFGSPSTNLYLDPEVAVNIADNWTIGASLTINVVNKIATVGQGLEVRHTFIKANKNEVFAHLFVDFSTRRSLLSGGGINKYNTTTIGPGFGFLHFFNPAIAFETKIDYWLINKESVRDNSYYRNGNFHVSLGLQYFFDSKLKVDSTEVNYSTNKGDWVIGGNANLGYNDEGVINRNFTPFNSLQPFTGYFITNHILVGSGLNYGNDANFFYFTLGVAPFSRYYFKIGRKRQLFAELQFSYNLQWQKRNNQDKNYDRSPKSYIISPAIGYSTRILPEVSFDIKFNMDNISTYLGRNDNWNKTKQFNFNVGLTAFLPN